MIIFNELAFDDIIHTTDHTWYSSENLNELIGRAEILTIQACTTGVVSGSALTVALQTSSDNKNWLDYGSAPISVNPVDNDETYVGRTAGLDLLAFSRLKITLGAASDECRLKLYVTGRVVAGSQ